MDREMAAPSERAPLLGHRKAAPTPARARRGELAAALLLVAALLYSSFSFASPGDERRPFSVKVRSTILIVSLALWEIQ